MLNQTTFVGAGLLRRRGTIWVSFFLLWLALGVLSASLFLVELPRLRRNGPPPGWLSPAWRTFLYQLATWLAWMARRPGLSGRRRTVVPDLFGDSHRSRPKFYVGANDQDRRLRAVDMSSSHQFELRIGVSSSENRLFIPKMEFSVRTGMACIYIAFQLGMRVSNWYLRKASIERG